MTTNAVKPAKILLTTDFSESASCAFPHAMGLTRRHGSELLVLHVVTGHSEYTRDNEQLQSYEQIIQANAKARLDRLELAGEDAVNIRRELFTAWTAKDGIIAFAEAERPDLIVMSTHGHGPIARFFLGGVARSVIAAAPCPVLCVKCAESGMLDEEGAGIQIRRIVVPVDLSEESRTALKLAIEYARFYDAHLHLMYVVHVDVPLAFFPEEAPPFFDLDEDLLSGISTRLREFQQEVDPDIENVVTIVEKGSPAKQIARYAESHAADLIVLSRKGLGGSPHGFGCVAGRLLQEAHCPTLVI